MLIPIGLILAFVLVVIFSNRRTRRCRWRENRAERQGDQIMWRCAACGASCFGISGKPPRTCLKPR